MPGHKNTVPLGFLPSVGLMGAALVTLDGSRRFEQLRDGAGTKPLALPDFSSGNFLNLPEASNSEAYLQLLSPHFELQSKHASRRVLVFLQHYRIKSKS